MKIAPYVEKLNSSNVFKEFKKRHKDAFMAAGFFIIDLEEGKNLHQIDYYVPSEKKIAAFTLDKGVTMQMMDMIHGAKGPEELEIKTNTDLDALQGILQDEMKNRTITEQLKKIIAILQKVDGKTLWNLNCVMSGMGILRAHVEDSSKSVLKMEKINMMDYVQKVQNPATMQKMQAQKSTAQTLQPKSSEKAAMEEEVKKLEILEKEIEKEKAQLEEKLSKEKKSKKD